MLKLFFISNFLFIKFTEILWLGFSQYSDTLVLLLGILSIFLRIQNSAKYLRAVNLFHKTLQVRCLTEFWRFREVFLRMRSMNDGCCELALLLDFLVQIYHRTFFISQFCTSTLKLPMTTKFSYCNGYIANILLNFRDGSLNYLYCDYRSSKVTNFSFANFPWPYVGWFFTNKSFNGIFSLRNSICRPNLKCDVESWQELAIWETTF